MQAQLEDLFNRSQNIINALRSNVFSPEGQKTLKRRWSITDTATLIDRSTASIRAAESSGALPDQQRGPNGRRLGYSLEDINRMRAHFGTQPWRSAEDDPVILSVSNFKGGVAKSTLAVHFAQYMAIQGYRVLLVDLDSQASSTTIFGLNPDIDINENETLSRFFLGEEHDVRYAIRATHWPGIDLIPCALHFYSTEYSMAAQVHGDASPLLALRAGLESVADNYDIIVMDPPPALGLISISALAAANAILIPVPPANIDFASTSHFLGMALDTLDQLQEYGIAPEYKFVRMVLSNYDNTKSTQKAIAEAMSTVFADTMLQTALVNSAEIDNASGRFETVYEQAAPLTSRDVQKRAMLHLDGVCSEIETLIRTTWPSHRPALIEEGKIPLR